MSEFRLHPGVSSSLHYSLVALAVGLASPLAAQSTGTINPPEGEAPDNAAPTASAEAGVDASSANEDTGDIVVTARRRSELAQSVPESLVVLTESMIEQSGIDSLLDIGKSFPNIGFRQDLSATSSFISVRGIAQTRNTDPAVAIVVDGVQMSNASQIRQQLFDVEQIEVLKGPQGAVYGRNAIAGAINVVTRAPSNDFEGGLSGAFGNAGRAEIAGTFAGPLVKDKLFFRVSAYLFDDDGTIKNSTLDRAVDFRTSKTARARLRWLPTHNSSIDLKFNHDAFKGGAYYYVVTRPVGAPFPVNNPRSNSNTFSGSPASKPISVNYSTINDASARAEVNFGAVTFNSVTAWSHTKERYGRVGEGVGGDGPGDLDFGPTDVLGNEQTYDIKSLSQEFRLTSTDSGPFEWMAGVYGIKVDRKDTLPVYVDLDGDGQLIDETPFFPLGTRRNIDAYAVFGQASYELTSGLEVSGALRYDRENRDQVNRDDPASGKRKASFDLVQPKVTLSYTADSGGLYYGTISRGFRSGGFNSPRSLFPTIYDAEKVWSYEVGTKGSFFGRAVRYSIAGFYQNIENRQDFVFDVRDVAQIVFTIPKSASWGVEAELNFRPMSGLNLGINAGLMDSKIKRFKGGALFPEPFADTEVEGNKLPGFSHWGVTFNATYAAELGNGWSTDIFGSYALRGDNYWDIRNTDKEKNVGIFNSNIALNKDSWSLIFWGENLFNEKYWSNWFNQQTTALPDIGYPAERRRYGIRLKTTF